MVKNKLLNKVYLFFIFFAVYISYFIFYEVKFNESGISQVYSSVVGGSMALIFIIPIYIFFLIKENKFFFTINVLMRFDTYSSWLTVLCKSIAFYSLKFILSLNLAFIIALILLNTSTPISTHFIYLLTIFPMQFLILGIISLIVCLFMFCLSHNHISFIIVYAIIATQYCFVRLLKLSSIPTISTLLFPNPEILSNFYLVYSYIICFFLLLILYFLTSLIIIKKDIFWRNVK